MTPTTFPATPQSPTLAPAQPNAANPQPAPTDFLLMLGQLVGAAVPAAAPAVASTPQPRAGVDETADVSDEDVAGVDVLGALLISLPIVPTDAAVSLKGAATDMTLELQLSREPAAARVAMLAAESQAATDLSTARPTEGVEPRTAFDASLSLQAPSETPQPARVATTSEAMLSRPVQTPVGAAAWADEIGSRLTLMAEQGKQTASLRLSPEHLGPLEIRIAIRDDQASVWFGAAHADTRAAIEHALPRLRELFASQGMSLADAGVFHEPPREQPTAIGHATTTGSESATDEGHSPAVMKLTLGLVDAYA